MTSPYLNRPRRELKDALRERGLDDAWLGASGKEHKVGTAASVIGVGGGQRPSSMSLVVGLAFVLGLLALGTASTLFQKGPTEVASEPQIENLMDIAPAAGPQDGDAADGSAVILPALFGKLPDAGTLDPSAE